MLNFISKIAQYIKGIFVRKTILPRTAKLLGLPQEEMVKLTTPPCKHIFTYKKYPKGYLGYDAVCEGKEVRINKEHCNLCNQFIVFMENR